MKTSDAIIAHASVPERANILLFVLNQLGEVTTELKLQKLVFQVQNKAKAPGGYRYFKHYYGPYSRELNIDTFTLMNGGLLEKKAILGREHPYWVFRITDQGKAYFNQSILPKMTSQLLQRMHDRLDEYSVYNHNALAEIVYKEWKIEDPKRVDSEMQILKGDLQAVMSFWEAVYFPECPAITYFLAFLEYSQEALEKASTKDNVIKSVLVRACKELNDILANIAQVCSKKDICPIEAEKGVCQNPDPSLYEIFSFIEDFCERNDILPKLQNRGLNELMTEDEYKRLQKTFKTFNISSSS